MNRTRPISLVLIKMSFLLVIGSILVACSLPNVSSQQGVSLPSASPTPTECSPSSGVTVEFQLGPMTTENAHSTQRVTISAKGFEADEPIRMVIEGKGKQTTERIETLSPLKTSKDGNFASPEILPLSEPQMHWQVYVTHKRGIACTQFVTV